MDELQSVLRKRQLREERRPGCRRMDRGTDVVHESGLGQLCRASPSSDCLRPLDDQRRAACACHRDRGGQAVRAPTRRQPRQASRKRPDHDVLPGREVQQRGLVEELDPGRRHRVLLDLGLGRLEWPRLVVDLGPLQPPCVLRVEAVALGQEVRQRARIGVDDVTDRPVADAKGRSFTAAPRALVPQPAVSPLGPHLGADVRKLVRAPRRLDGEIALGIEAEEPDPRLSSGRDVRAGVDLEKGRDQRQRRKPARPQPGDAKRRDADPGFVLEEVELETIRKPRTQRVGGRPPVGEQQLVPGLAHDPRGLGQRPGPVIGRLQRGRLPGRCLQGVQEAPGE